MANVKQWVSSDTKGWIPKKGTDDGESYVALRGYSGSNWEDWRNNNDVEIQASTTQTANGNTTDQTNRNHKGIVLFIDITAVSGTFAAGEGLSLSLEAKDPVSSKYAKLLTIASALQATSFFAAIIYPNNLATGEDVDAVLNAPLPRTWRISWTITGTTPSFTFSIGGSYIL